VERDRPQNPKTPKPQNPSKMRFFINIFIIICFNEIVGRFQAIHTSNLKIIL
jgi:hypothetical protein